MHRLLLRTIEALKEKREDEILRFGDFKLIDLLGKGQQGIVTLAKNPNEKLFPEGYELLPGTNQIYELEFAIGEYKSLDSSELLARSAYFHKVKGEETFHYKLCAGSPLYVDESSLMRLKSFFQVYKFKTGYATHGLFPYRGKFHPQLVKAILNNMGLKKNEIVLDPMTGSGTTNIEASLIGLDSIGIDVSPFCRYSPTTCASQNPQRRKQHSSNAARKAGLQRRKGKRRRAQDYFEV